MRKILYLISMLLTIIGAVMLFQQPAYAYADPGTGLLAIQAVGSALVATGWYLRKKIYNLFHRSHAQKVASSDSSANNFEDQC